MSSLKINVELEVFYESGLLVLSRKQSTSFNNILEILGLNSSVEISSTNKATNSLLAIIKKDQSSFFSQKTALEIFSQLRNTCCLPLSKYIKLTFQKKSKLVNYDWLSDGEQAFLGQTALFNLLEGSTNTLFLLDEPEKAFAENTRQLFIKLLLDNLAKTNCTVLFTSKSSIVLTDLFDWQILLLTKLESPTGIFSRIVAGKLYTKTFAASPTEIMCDVLKCETTVALAASNYLDDILSSASDFEPTDLPNIITKLETIEGQLGAGYYQLDFRRRLRALRKL